MSASTMSARNVAAADEVNDLRRPVQRGRLAFLWQALLMDKLALTAAIILLALILVAIFAPAIAPYDPAKQSLSMRNDPPLTRPAPDAFPYVLGADALGRDVLSRLIFGARVSLAVGAASVLISGLIGATLGLIAGYYRGTTDDIIMRAVDVWMGFPSLLLALIVLYVTGAGFWNVVLVLAVTRWMVYARVTRSLVLSYRENVFIEAARATGCTDRQIITRHLLPNLLSPILVLATLETATIILIEASLSFLGLGLPISVPSWGQMLAQGREYVTSAWWLVTFPGLAILITALALNLLATWARTVTDPAQRWRFARRMKPASR
ncbi:MAG: ABC transporter permease [Thermomicrobiales bacterium]|nr:ABC transporter permease [Thermomicrobiales bacterium]